MEYSNRYRKVWQLEEDEHLKDVVVLYNAKGWKKIAQVVSQRICQERTSKQCRERWMHHIKINAPQAEWTDSEIKLLFELQLSIGSKWSRISPFFPRKSENDIKNFFYATIRRNIRRFNNGKTENEQIKGPLDKIMKISEVREILLLGKSLPKRFFKEKKLSVGSIKKIYEIHGVILAEEENNFLENYDYQNYEGYQDLENIELPNSDAYESAPYIDHAVLWE
ncbi:hypothetical protein SteCoe_21110 [Stentor coeruleus]|uniref:Myb-like DNA-binding domain containing protein n=1 Tax=Stentor coeruleus TaxID=5963 RepID=A0A1R2BQE3_9CILI|nr:hypothetical protein SteCoe_21110 [Stentor coeruleus]